MAISCATGVILEDAHRSRFAADGGQGHTLRDGAPDEEKEHGESTSLHALPAELPAAAMDHRMWQTKGDAISQRQKFRTTYVTKTDWVTRQHNTTRHNAFNHV